MTQGQLVEKLKQLRKENQEDKTASKRLIEEFLNQKNNFFGEAAEARSVLFAGFPLTHKQNLVLCEYIRKLERMTELDFLQ